MLYGNDLIRELEVAIDSMQTVRGKKRKMIDIYQAMIQRIQEGGYAWFPEYATLDGEVVDFRWQTSDNGKYLIVILPNGEMITITDITPEGLAKANIQYVECKRPAWIERDTDYNYYCVKSDINYATGEKASSTPIEIRTFNF